MVGSVSSYQPVIEFLISGESVKQPYVFEKYMHLFCFTGLPTFVAEFQELTLFNTHVQLNKYFANA